MLESEKNFSKYQIRPGANPEVAPTKITLVIPAVARAPDLVDRVRKPGCN